MSAAQRHATIRSVMDAADLVRRERDDQGLPAQVEDDAAYREVARVLAHAENRTQVANRAA